MKTLNLTIASALSLFTVVSASAQEQATTANSNSGIRPIPQSDQMFRKTIWRSIDLREKQNQPMFSEGKEITRVILEAVKRGELPAYAPGDSLARTLTADQVKGASSYEEDILDVPGGGDDWGGSGAAKPGAKPAASDDPWGAAPAKSTAAKPQKRIKVDKNGKQMRDRKGKLIYENVPVAAAPIVAPPTFNLQPYRFKDLYQMDLKEDMVFDKKRSRMYHNIQSITLIVPASKNKKNVDLPIATFKYSDLVKVFRNNPQNAIWFNAQNDAQHKNLADAFELWLFNSYITKVSNPGDSNLSDVYGSQKEGILAAQQTASDLVEYEYNLWSF